jgi:hypothetical protein
MTQNRASLSRRWILGAAVVLLASAARLGWTWASSIVVHKGPQCSCCSRWAGHLEKAGFLVTVIETADLEAVHEALRVPADLTSCHTAEVDGYVLEGHVPAAAVRRLLQERSNCIGLAVPGMPAGSPGMGLVCRISTKSFCSAQPAGKPSCNLWEWMQLARQMHNTICVVLGASRPSIAR